MIPSVYIGDDCDLVESILALHLPCRENPLILDCTYGYGRFWQSSKREVIGLDLRMAELQKDIARSTQPQTLAAGTLVASSFEAMPFRSMTFDAVVFDPPFLTRGSDGFRMKARYTALESYGLLLDTISRAVREISRVLKSNGILLFKCMDWTEGSRRRWLHIDVINLLVGQRDFNWRLDDLFVKVGFTNMKSKSWLRQHRSRSAHTYFLVFRPARKLIHREKVLQGNSLFPCREATKVKDAQV